MDERTMLIQWESNANSDVVKMVRDVLKRFGGEVHSHAHYRMVERNMLKCLHYAAQDREVMGRVYAARKNKETVCINVGNGVQIAYKKGFLATFLSEGMLSRNTVEVGY